MVVRWRGRSVARGAAALMLAAVAAALGPLTAAPAWALDDPPDVVGLSVPDATAKLAEWNKAVLFDYVPPADIDLGVDPSLIVVARAEQVQPSPSVVIASNRPVVRLFLGRRVPDLTGLTADRAREELARVALRMLSTPDTAGLDWVVLIQSPAPGAIVEFVQGVRVVDVSLGAPPTPTAAPPTSPPPPPPPRFSTVDLVVVGGSGVGAALLLLLGGLALRRSRLRRATRRTGPPAGERIEVRPHPGQVSGPELAGAAPAVAVRLVARHGPVTIDVEEVGR